jgi:hypothetical protein
LAKLVQQPCGGIAGRRLGAARAHAEAHQRVSGQKIHDAILHPEDMSNRDKWCCGMAIMRFKLLFALAKRAARVHLTAQISRPGIRVAKLTRVRG